MVNASLNWASIVGIVLAVGGAVLYFMRSFKPALARDYDVFFAAVGLLCGGILFFQGWRLDPILQFGQFLLAGTTVFFAYESVRLRGITTEQARRSSYFDDEEPAPFRPRGGMGAGPWDGPDRFSEPEPLRRRIRSREEEEDEFYRPRRSSRAAIPERAASRQPYQEDWQEEGPPTLAPERGQPSPYRAGPRETPTDFGSRRRDEGVSGRRGTRPVPGSRRPAGSGDGPVASAPSQPASALGPKGMPQGSPLRRGPGRESGPDVSDAEFSPIPPARRSTATGPSPSPQRPEEGTPPPRDNASRFDD
ncbi:MAG: Ycf66 family protein [Cyanobacteriota bacterium]